MKHIKHLATAALLAWPVAAFGTTDITFVTTTGICTEFVFGAERLTCSGLTSIHTDHSQRSSFTLESSGRVIRFEGGQDMRLAPDGYLLLIDAVADGDKSYPAQGQCTATSGSSKGQVLGVTCDADFANGKARVVFKSTGGMTAGQL